MFMSTFDKIEKYKLLVRPSLVGGWWVAIWRGVTGHTPSQITVWGFSIAEGETIEDAVNNCIKIIEENKKCDFLEREKEYIEKTRNIIEKNSKKFL